MLRVTALEVITRDLLICYKYSLLCESTLCGIVSICNSPRIKITLVQLKDLSGHQTFLDIVAQVHESTRDKTA